ncbi:hypothetical protein L6164_000358 [Bauhinia variegata]|uniref:Uncharacterized protein n=1 Tax=Bauhinia variegata TaxID=167791 RepID=A0ACB9Q6I8_BAUVA|nr:hypothetical protein L6164_000358 [Bauhinia variegata]
MAGFARKKRITDPLGDEVRARLVGADFHRQLSYVSSGSDHSADDPTSPSPSLSELVHGFLEDDNSEEGHLAGNDLDSERVDSVSDCAELVEEIRGSTRMSKTDPHRKRVLDHVSAAIENFSFLRSEMSVLRRNVITCLKENGYNAGICKTKWDSSGGVTPGNHEFIDVVEFEPSTGKNSRYFVELEFPSHFEIARPTSQYSEILNYLPNVFVGRAEELKCTVRAMCHVAKRCFRSRGLTVPPWRKNRYMQNKWFSPYRRTTNPVHGNGLTVKTGAANCRLIGFDDVVSEAGRRGVFVRTR